MNNRVGGKGIETSSTYSERFRHSLAVLQVRWLLLTFNSSVISSNSQTVAG